MILRRICHQLEEEVINIAERWLVSMGLTLITHPIARYRLTLLRSKDTDMMTFRRLLKELSVILAVETTRDLEVQSRDVITPLEQKASGVELRSQVLLLPIIRAGLSMLDGFLEVIPEAKVGFLGIYRDESTFQPKSYYYHIPKVPEPYAIIIDPMLATGGSIRKAIELLNKGIAPSRVRKLKVVTIISYRKTLDALLEEFPETEFYTVGIDETLNERAFIVPGLGDAGDRAYGSKEK